LQVFGGVYVLGRRQDEKEVCELNKVSVPLLLVRNYLCHQWFAARFPFHLVQFGASSAITYFDITAENNEEWCECTDQSILQLESVAVI